MSLDNIRIVLVGTTHPGNIGSAARAMKTMGLHQLVLVSPQCDLGDTALAMAANAGDVLRSARRTDTLDEAVTDCTLVIGTSARQRSVDWPLADLHDAARKVANNAPAATAVVFGREKSGLTNDELDHCNLMVRIATAPDAASLNLAAAVQVVAYELRRACTGDRVTEAEPRHPDDEPATSADLERLFSHLENTLRGSGFLIPRHEGVVMRRLRSFILRATPTHRDVRILRGICASVQDSSTAVSAGGEEYV